MSSFTQHLTDCGLEVQFSHHEAPKWMEDKDAGTSPGVLGRAGSHCWWPCRKFAGVCGMLPLWPTRQQGNCLFFRFY